MVGGLFATSANEAVAFRLSEQGRKHPGVIVGAFSIWHWLVLVVFFGIAWIIPAWMIVKKAGYSPAWSLLGFIPILNVLLLWVFAFIQWPSLKNRM